MESKPGTSNDQSNLRPKFLKKTGKLSPQIPRKMSHKRSNVFLPSTGTTSDVADLLSEPHIVTENQESTHLKPSGSQIQPNLRVPSPKITNSSSSSPLLSSGRSPRPGCLSFDRMQECKAVVERAVKDGKIFTMQGSYPAIRAAMLSRGWLEKLYSKALKEKETNGACKDGKPTSEESEPKSKHFTNPWLKEAFTRDDYSSQMQPALYAADQAEKAFISRLLKDHAPNLIWTVNRDFVAWRRLTKNQTVNRFSCVPFTTKVGLSQIIRNLHWTGETCSADTFFPRCYHPVHDEADLQAWIDDYRMTACIALLRWIVENPQQLTQEENGKAALHMRSVDFAVARVVEYIQFCIHEDLDRVTPRILIDIWNEFLDIYYDLVHQSGFFYCGQLPPAAVIGKANSALEKVRPYWPQYSFDGTLNVWILKPGALSRGRGILIQNQLSSILDLFKSPLGRENKFVIQKYIERPMLIHNTKFDIRQWFLVTDWNPLTVWMYKEAYLRFCSQPFSLGNLHESIHLCNNAIQCRYMGGSPDFTAKPASPGESFPSGSPQLSPEHMWYQKTFQEYLASLGHASAWEDIIVPSMREAIVGVFLASQEAVGAQKRGFELYGADFMLTPDLQVWLIEINACPCMAPSTSVTADLCTRCLDDIIKVVVDWRDDKRASTGLFELVYKQLPAPVPQYSGLDLTVTGQAIPVPVVGQTQARHVSSFKAKTITAPVPETRTFPRISAPLASCLPSPISFRGISAWRTHVTSRVQDWMKNTKRTLSPRMPVRNKNTDTMTIRVDTVTDDNGPRRATKFAQTVSGAILVRGTQKRLLCSPDKK